MNLSKKVSLHILVFCGVFILSFPTVTMEEQELASTVLHSSALGGVTPQQRVRKKQKDIQNLQKPIPSINEWPKSLADFSLEELNHLHGHCLRMLEYEDLMLGNNTWTRRLEHIEFLQKISKSPEPDPSREKIQKLIPLSESPGASDDYVPYKIRRIYLNTKNPFFLDLHGIASAKAAENKVLQFIRIAKSKKKKQVTVITGKGNHVNEKGNRGVLFKALPKWIDRNKNIKDFNVREDGGSYMIYLTPPSRIRIDFDSSYYLCQKIFYETYRDPYFNKITILEGSCHFPKNLTGAMDLTGSKVSKKRVKRKKVHLENLCLKDFIPLNQKEKFTRKPSVATAKFPQKVRLLKAKGLFLQQKNYSALPPCPEETRNYILSLFGDKKTNNKSPLQKSKTNLLKTTSLPRKTLTVPKAITGFPTVISHKKAKEYLNQLCQIAQRGVPQYNLISQPNPNIKAMSVTINGFGTHQIETETKPQQFLAQEVYKKITGSSVPKKKAKELLEKICQEKGYGVPKYQIPAREFRVMVSVDDFSQEEVSPVSQDYAEKLVAKKMYEFLRNSTS